MRISATFGLTARTTASFDIKLLPAAALLASALALASGARRSPSLHPPGSFSSAHHRLVRHQAVAGRRAFGVRARLGVRREAQSELASAGQLFQRAALPIERLTGVVLIEACDRERFAVELLQRCDRQAETQAFRSCPSRLSVDHDEPRIAARDFVAP